MAWWLRYKKWLLSCSKKRKELKASYAQSKRLEEEMKKFKGFFVPSILTGEDLNEAELPVVRFSQEMRVPEEIKSLLPRNSSLGIATFYL